MAMRRVVATSVVVRGERVGAEQKLAALVSMLTEWASWQGQYRMRLGYPSRSISGYSSRSDGSRSDDLYQAVDNARFEAIDTAVDDLMPAQRAAVQRRYGVAAVFRFPRDDYAEQLDLAHQALMRLLPRKGVDIL